MKNWKSKLWIILSIIIWPVFMVFWLVFGTIASCIFYALFDLWWLLRLSIIILSSLFSDPILVTDTASVSGICWTTDIDYFGHMNNGRYFRDLDFARFDFKFRSGIASYTASVKGAYIVMHASTIRYRKSLNFLQRYTVTTKLVFFDERSLYYEQNYVTKNPTTEEEFVCAVVLCKMTAVNMNVKEMMKSKFGIDKIEIDPQQEKELHLFIEMQNVSSSRLKGLKMSRSVASDLCGMGNDSSNISESTPKAKIS
jgi:acyl-CoA thioesterase FadM